MAGASGISASSVRRIWRARAPAAPGPPLQAIQGPAVCGQAARHRRALCRSAGPRRRPFGGREEPDLSSAVPSKKRNSAPPPKGSGGSDWSRRRSSRRWTLPLATPWRLSARPRPQPSNGSSGHRRSGHGSQPPPFISAVPWRSAFSPDHLPRGSTPWPGGGRFAGRTRIDKHCRGCRDATSPTPRGGPCVVCTAAPKAVPTPNLQSHPFSSVVGEERAAAEYPRSTGRLEVARLGHDGRFRDAGAGGQSGEAGAHQGSAEGPQRPTLAMKTG